MTPEAEGTTDLPAERLWRFPLLVAICVLLSAEVCISLTLQAERIAAIWLPNAVVLAALLRRPVREWELILSFSFIANLLVDLANGFALVLSAGLPLCNLGEVLLCALTMRAFGDATLRLDLARVRPLAVFTALVLGPAPLLSGLAAAGLIAGTQPVGFSHVLRHWYCVHAIGLITVTPVLVACQPDELASLFRRERLGTTGGCLLLMSVTLAAVFTQSAYPLLFLVFPPLMLINFQLGFPGVVLALAMTVVAAIAATAADMGPLTLIHGGLREQVLVLQGFVAVAGLTSLQLASVLATRARLEADLRRANEEAVVEIAARRTSEQAAGTARRDAEAAREQALAASRAKTDFLAAMSHEIRTPLNSIIGFTGLMLDDPALAGVLRQRTAIVASAGTALLTVVNDILDMSRIEAGRIEIERVPFAPRALFNNAVALVQGLAAAKKIALTCKVDPDFPEQLVGDAGRLQQVMLNLLNNAVKFTAQGVVALDARVSASDGTGVHLLVSVSDTGPGIEAATQDRLFQRFSQADASTARRYGGSGLGLAICKQLVELMGGEIGVRSEVGRGSTFWFTVALPRSEKIGAGPSAQPTGPAMRTGRLLVVEDIEVNQMLARALLEADGHRVDVAGSGEAAVAAVRAIGYDLVLMDVQMPGMDGLAATRAIRALPGGGALPIIAITANVLADEVAAFRIAGLDDHVGKPIDRGELRAAIARALQPKSAAGADLLADIALVEEDSAGGVLAGGALAEGTLLLKTAGVPVFDAAVFESIAAILGPERTRDTLTLFDRDLETRLCRVAPDQDEVLRQDAHVVTGIAGAFGFAALSRSCSRIASTSPEAGAIARVEVAAVLRAKADAVVQLAMLLRAGAGADRDAARAA